MTKQFSIFVLLLVSVVLTLAQKPASYLSHAVQELDNDFINVVTTDLPSAVTFTMVYSRNKCPKCNTMKDIVDRVAKSLHQQVKFTAVDINDPAADQILSVLNVDPSNPPTLPILRLLSPKSSKDITVTSAKDLRETALSALSSAASITRLTSATSKAFLSFAKSPLPKILLFAAKKESSPTGQSLTMRLTGRANVAEVLKSERKLVRQFEVDDFPSIVLVRPDGDPILYGGVRKLGPILAWAEPHLPSKAPAMPYVEDATCLATHCAAHLGLCAIVTLPADAIEADASVTGHSAGHLAVAAAAVDAANLLGGQTVSIVYMKDTHPFVRWLGISPETYPQLTAFSARKAVGTSMVGSFSYEATLSWLTDLSSGRVVTSPLAAVTDYSDDDVRLGGAISIAEALKGHDAAAFAALSSLPAFNGSTDCSAIIDKRIKQQKVISSSSSSSPRQQQQQQQPPAAEAQPFNMNNGLPTWSAPSRPPAKRGQLLSLHVSDRLKAALQADEGVADSGDIKVVDELEILLKRNVPVVIRVLSDNDSITTISDDLMDRAAKAANSMVVFASLSCEDAQTLLHSSNTVVNCGDIIMMPPPGDVDDIKDIMKNRILNSKKYTIPSSIPSNVDSKVVEWALSVYDTVATSADIDIPILTSAEQFQPFMMKNLLLPKAILFTDKSKVPYLMKALAHEFLYYADIAIVTVNAATEPVMKQFQVDATPAMRIINPTIKPQQDGQHAISMEMVPVQKQLIYYNNIARVLDNIVKNKIPPSQAPKVEMRAPKDEL